MRDLSKGIYVMTDFVLFKGSKTPNQTHHSYIEWTVQLVIADLNTNVYSALIILTIWTGALKKSYPFNLVPIKRITCREDTRKHNLLAAPNPTSTDPVYRAHVIGFKNDTMNKLKHKQTAI